VGLRRKVNSRDGNWITLGLSVNKKLIPSGLLVTRYQSPKCQAGHLSGLRRIRN